MSTAHAPVKAAIGTENYLTEIRAVYSKAAAKRIALQVFLLGTTSGVGIGVLTLVIL